MAGNPPEGKFPAGDLVADAARGGRGSAGTAALPRVLRADWPSPDSERRGIEGRGGAEGCAEAAAAVEVSRAVEGGGEVEGIRAGGGSGALVGSGAFEGSGAVGGDVAARGGGAGQVARVGSALTRRDSAADGWGAMEGAR